MITIVRTIALLCLMIPSALFSIETQDSRALWLYAGSCYNGTVLLTAGLEQRISPVFSATLGLNWHMETGFPGLSASARFHFDTLGLDGFYTGMGASLVYRTGLSFPLFLECGVQFPIGVLLLEGSLTASFDRVWTVSPGIRAAMRL